MPIYTHPFDQIRLGFAITADAYWAVLDGANLRPRLADLLAGLDKNDVVDLAERSRRARGLVRDAGVPEAIWAEVCAAYQRLCDEYGPNVDVAVRSSATAEDPSESFAEQQESFLNVRGLPALREAVSRCFASLFTDRAISYRVDHGFGHLDVALSIAVQATRLRVAEVEGALGVRAPVASVADGRPRAPIGSILVALDFSSHARAALDRAARLPLQIGASLELLYVIPEERFTAIVAHREGEAKQFLDTARGIAELALPSAGLHDVVASVDWGTPSAVIADRAHRSRAELIVLGRHGERRFGDLVIGSTAERAIRGGDVSVLVVAHPPKTPYRRPLVAVDLSASSQLALELAARICDPGVEEIDVVHVSDPKFAPAFGTEELTEFLATVRVGVRWNLTQRYAEPRSSILDEAKLRGADLIAIGTAGRTGLARIWLGSVAEGVLRGATCDVLVARLPG